MAQTAVSIGANVFQFFTRNPRGGDAKPIDNSDVAAFMDYAAKNSIGPILAHAPYTLNAAGADPRVRDFAEMVMKDDLLRLEKTPGVMYNFHPGSHVSQGAEKGMDLISSMLVRVFRETDAALGARRSTEVLLETMSGKGSEVGRNFGEIRAIRSWGSAYASTRATCGTAATTSPATSTASSPSSTASWGSSSSRRSTSTIR